MDLIKIDYKKLDIEYYNQFIKKCNNVTPFHNMEWLLIINEIRKDLNLKFFIIKENEKYIAIMPFFEKYNMTFIMSSLPYSCYGGFAYNSINEKEIKIFLKENNIFKNKITMIVSKDDLYCNLLSFRETLYTYVINCNNNYDTVFSRFSTKTRNQVRKALKSDVEYKLAETDQEVNECIELYNLLIKKHNIKRPYNRNLFYLLKKYNNTSINFWIAKYNGTVIAYSVFVSSSDAIFYWLSSFDNKFSKLNAPLGILSIIIQKACKDNKIVNLGAVPYDNEGLKHFKKGLGAEEVGYGFYYSTGYAFIKKLREIV